uniref:Uncharacterized protein n=1 Tax=Romanomermis culicivorax TaxID=13658 RepID=A0A915JIG2_ROMCU
MDVETPTTTKSETATMTMISLLTRASRWVPSTTIMPTPATSTPVAATTSTVTSQPNMVINT